MPDDIYDACIDLNEGQLSAGGYDTYRAPPPGFPSAPSIDGEPIRDAALPPLVENLREFFNKLTRHFNFTFKDYVKGRDEFDALFFRGGAGGTEFRTLLQNFAQDVFPQMFEFIDARQFFNNVNIQHLVDWFWWAVNQGPGKNGDFEVVLVDGIGAGQDPIQKYITDNVKENPEYFYPLVPSGPAEDPAAPGAVIRLALAMEDYSGGAADPPTVNVQICADFAGGAPDGNTQNCVLPYLGTFGGRVKNWPNVHNADVIRVVACPDPTYPLMAVGAEYLDDPINTVKLWFGTPLAIAQGWEVVSETENRFVVGVGTHGLPLGFDHDGNPNDTLGDFGDAMLHTHPGGGFGGTDILSDSVTSTDFANHVPPFLALYWIRRVEF